MMTMQSPINAWRLYPERYRLEGNRCSNCNTHYFPKKCICTCGCRTFELHTFKPTGMLMSFSCVTQPSHIFKTQNQLIVGLIKLDEGPMIMGQIVDVIPEKIKISTRFRAVVRRLYTQDNKSIIHYGYAFIPEELW